MQYHKIITLKDGRTCTLRNGTAEDGQALLDIFIMTHAQTDFLIDYPDEITMTVEQEIQFLREKAESENEIEILAEAGGNVVGSAGIWCIRDREKIRHRAGFGISVDEAYWSLGIGRALTEACIECARAAGYKQLELDVLADNERAHALYRSLGFVDYGRNPRGINLRTSGYHELVLMRLELDRQAAEQGSMEGEMVELRPITEENFLDAFHLKLAPGQERFVSHPIRSLAQAYVYRNQCQPFGIYAKGKMVGYVMVIYDYDVPEYDIWHMMIDESAQGHGYGSAALDQVIEYIRTKPFGTSDRVALTCSKNNPVARKMYEKQGFLVTGVEDEDEIELALTV